MKKREGKREGRREGSLHIHIGCMFSGKTTNLLCELFNFAETGLSVLYVNHSFDTRNASASFSTHNPLYREKLEKHSNVRMMSLRFLQDISDQDVIKKYDVIGIDESQFFPDLYERVKYFVDSLGCHILVYGLDGDSKREKFGQILDLIPISDTVEKHNSYCKNCSGKNSEEKTIKKAIFSHCKKNRKSGQINIGSGDKYIALCRSCYLELN